MPHEVTRRRFMFQTLGVIGGATVSGPLLPLLADNPDPLGHATTPGWLAHLYYGQY